jgi:uncharacterized protein YeaC (DUF1315 family)
MILSITPEILQRMKMAILEGDEKEALKIVKKFVKRLEQLAQSGMKSHLG